LLFNGDAMIYLDITERCFPSVSMTMKDRDSRGFSKETAVMLNGVKHLLAVSLFSEKIVEFLVGMLPRACPDHRLP
jgi:hypothetical protein